MEAYRESGLREVDNKIILRQTRDKTSEREEREGRRWFSTRLRSVTATVSPFAHFPGCDTCLLPARTELGDVIMNARAKQDSNQIVAKPGKSPSHTVQKNLGLWVSVWRCCCYFHSNNASSSSLPHRSIPGNSNHHQTSPSTKHFYSDLY